MFDRSKSTIVEKKPAKFKRDPPRGSGGGDGKTPGDGGSESLSPAQRRDILMRRVKVETKWYDGNPDTTPVRSDESPYLVKLTLFVSQLINNR